MAAGGLVADAKNAVYAEYLRSISASYVQAMSGLRTRSEDYSLYAATARIEVLCRAAIAGPARDLADTVMNVHSRIAAGAGFCSRRWRTWIAGAAS